MRNPTSSGVYFDEDMDDVCDDDAPNDDFIDIFNELFDFSLMLVAHKYHSHRAKKGDSWQHMSPGELRTKINEEFGEFILTKNGSSDEYEELLDFVLVGLMLIEQLSNK